MGRVVAPPAATLDSGLSMFFVLHLFRNRLMIQNVVKRACERSR